HGVTRQPGQEQAEPTLIVLDTCGDCHPGKLLCDRHPVSSPSSDRARLICRILLAVFIITIMGSKWRTRAVPMRNVVMLALAMALVGVAYGAMSVGAGLPVWMAPVLGVIVLAGSSEMLYVGLAATTSPWVALPAALLVNVRHVPYEIG